MYNLEIAPDALKFLEKLARANRKICDRLMAAIDFLRASPHAGKKLIGKFRDCRCLRVGDYRIIYSVIEQRILIQIIRIGHRREIYR